MFLLAPVPYSSSGTLGGGLYCDLGSTSMSSLSSSSASGSGASASCSRCQQTHMRMGVLGRCGVVWRGGTNVLINHHQPRPMTWGPRRPCTGPARQSSSWTCQRSCLERCDEERRREIQRDKPQKRTFSMGCLATSLRIASEMRKASVWPMPTPPGGHERHYAQIKGAYPPQSGQRSEGCWGRSARPTPSSLHPRGRGSSGAWQEQQSRSLRPCRALCCFDPQTAPS